MNKQFDKNKAKPIQHNDSQYTLSQSIAQDIKHILCIKGLTLEDFAYGMLVSTSEVQNWLSGKYDFSLNLISKIEEKLNVTLIKRNTESKDIPSKQKSQFQITTEYLTRCHNYHRIFLHLIGRMENSF